MSWAERSKKTGEVWNKIDSETKNRFVEEAKAEKEKYQQDFKVQLLDVMDRYHLISQEWFDGGGEEALKAAKAESKKLKKEAKGLNREAKQLEKSFKKKSHSPSPTLPDKKVKSAEFIEDAGSSSDLDDKDGN